MPVVDTVAKILGHFVEILLRFKVIGVTGADGRKTHNPVGLVLGHRSTAGRLTQILRIGGPITFRNFDGNQAGQRLLLTRAVQSGEFAANGHGRRRDGVFGWLRARAQV